VWPEAQQKTYQNRFRLSKGNWWVRAISGAFHFLSVLPVQNFQLALRQHFRLISPLILMNSEGAQAQSERKALAGLPLRPCVSAV
jgi:hypothetical protein